MTQTLKYPFKLSHAFFTTINISRVPEIPETLETAMPVQIKIVKDKLPKRLQINLKIATERKSAPLTTLLELVGLFDLIENQPHASNDLIIKYVNERALFMLWPYIEQMFKQITGQMGMNPQTLSTPYSYQYLLPDLDGTNAEEE